MLNGVDFGLFWEGYKFAWCPDWESQEPAKSYAIMFQKSKQRSISRRRNHWQFDGPAGEATVKRKCGRLGKESL